MTTLDCEIIYGKENDSQKSPEVDVNNTLRYIDYIINVNNAVIKEKKENSNNILEVGKRRDGGWILIGNDNNDHNNNELDKHLHSEKYTGGNLLWINKIEFTIKKKSLFRVYSRNSWKKHGRFYGY